MNAFSLEKFSSLREKYRENIEFSMSSPFSIKILIVSGAFEDSLNFLEYLKNLKNTWKMRKILYNNKEDTIYRKGRLYEKD